MGATFALTIPSIGTNTSNPKVAFHIAATNRDILIPRFRVDCFLATAAFINPISWKLINASGTAGSNATYSLNILSQTTETADFTLTVGPSSSTQWSSQPTFTAATTGGGDWTQFATGVPANSGNVIDYFGHGTPDGGILIKKGTTSALVLPTTATTTDCLIWAVIHQ